MTYYTLQIKYQNGIEVDTHEIPNLQPGAMEPVQWQRTLRENLYKTGFCKEIEPGIIRFVSPFHIHDAYLIKQRLS